MVSSLSALRLAWRSVISTTLLGSRAKDLLSRSHRAAVLISSVILSVSGIHCHPDCVSGACDAASAIRYVSGDGQTGIVGQVVGQPLVVKVTSASGADRKR